MARKPGRLAFIDSTVVRATIAKKANSVICATFRTQHSTAKYCAFEGVRNSSSAILVEIPLLETSEFVPDCALKPQMTPIQSASSSKSSGRSQTFLHVKRFIPVV